MQLVRKAIPVQTLLVGSAIFIATPLMIALAVSMGRTPGVTYESPAWSIAIHLATAIPALPLGAYVLWSRKGDRKHCMLGRIWAALMLITAIDSFWIREVTGHIGPIHIFAVITLIAVPRGIYAIRKGNVAGHKRAMLYSYIGLCTAFAFALNPQLRLGHFLFG